MGRYRRSPFPIPGWLLPVVLATLVAGCAVKPGPSGRAVLEPVSFSALAGWGADDGMVEAARAFAAGCPRIARPPKADAPDWRPACAAIAAALPADSQATRAFFERWFRPYAVGDSDAGPDGLFTGYYEPALRGARRPGGSYRTPIYGRPDDLVTADLGRFDAGLTGRRITGRVQGGALVPYPTRAEIDSGALGKAAHPLVWVDSPIDAFFLQVQGSGRITLNDGGVMRLGYAGSNGRAYTAIGRALVAWGALARDAVTMQAIRGWLAAHPGEAAALMRQNARYVFFRKLDGPGPVGALGVPLTDGRSLAVDPAAVPLGAPVWLATADPMEPGRPLRRLMVAQDSGTAIKGAVRGDIFFGHGLPAARRAGAMKQTGRYYVLLPKVR